MQKERELKYITVHISFQILLHVRIEKDTEKKKKVTISHHR